MPRKSKQKPSSKKTSKAKSPSTSDPVLDYRHADKRKNIPPSGLEAQGVIKEVPRIRYEYNPHLPPVLRFGSSREDEIPELLRKAQQAPLTANEAKVLAHALRNHDPWLEWTGKREKKWFEVDPVALHIHERVSTKAILKVLEREDVQRDLYADPQQAYAQAVQFYQHDIDWANRMILGDEQTIS